MTGEAGLTENEEVRIMNDEVKGSHLTFTPLGRLFAMRGNCKSKRRKRRAPISPLRCHLLFLSGW